MEPLPPLEHNEPTIPTEHALAIPSWVGPVVGIIAMLIVVAIGGLYLWGSLLSEEDLVVPPPARINQEPETRRAVADVQITETMSPSTEIDAIEADIDSTQVDATNADVQAMDSEISTFVNSTEAP